MLTFTSVFQTQGEVFCPSGYTLEQLLYFDIETTGFSPDTSSLYLIGCLYYRDSAWHTLQWFADDYHSEAALLDSFFSFMKSFSLLLHYNGSSFDLPYLQKKCQQHKLSFSFEEIKSLDLYKSLSPCKKLLSLPDLKQKTLEGALGLKREDRYDGGQLISVYVEYIHQTLKKQEDRQDALSLLLLHNKEDLEGLFFISRLLLSPKIEAQKEAPFTFHLTLPYCLSQPVSLEKGAVRLTAREASGALSLLPFTGELKYFYPDYKSYYYLPLEDTAIHKSVAEYVEKEYRERARACNCYTRRFGVFLPLPKAFSLPEGTPCFYQAYKSSPPWFELTDAFLSSPEHILAYARASLL